MSPARAGRPGGADSSGGGAPSADALFGAMPAPCLALDPTLRIVDANPAAEAAFARSVSSLSRKRLPDLVGADSRLVDLVHQAQRGPQSIAEYAVDVATPERGGAMFDVHIVHLYDGSDALLMMLHPCSVAQKMDRSLNARSSSRSLSGLSAMMAHEIKNPLSGISGAAQLLEMSLGDSETELLTLIQEEVDRIRALVDRMDAFDAGLALERKPVNVHDVLEQARRSASAGFARHIRFREVYDPSLPPAPGDRTQLLQAVSNLLKNAADAAPRQGGEITLRTAYRPGVRIAVPGGEPQSLPLEIAVLDNGPGVPETIEGHIFEPFVTTKSAGTGLGLALVAKIVGDHGGVVEHERRDARTCFRLLLPVWTGPTLVATGG